MEEKKYQFVSKCPSCGALQAASNKACKVCGYDFTRDEAQKGELFSNLASRDKRLANFILDIVFINIICYLLGYIIVVSGLGEQLVKINVNGILLGLIIAYIYYFALEKIYGKTLAKFITRTRIVSSSNAKPHFLFILVRSLVRFIPFEFCSYLGSNVGLHDIISKTRVIND